MRKIYVYECPKLYPGYIKIGETTRTDVEQRIWEQFPQHPKSLGKPFNILLEFISEADNGDFFLDKDIHLLLDKQGFKHEGEWYQCSVEDVMQAINLITMRSSHFQKEEIETKPRKPRKRKKVNNKGNHITKQFKAPTYGTDRLYFNSWILKN